MMRLCQRAVWCALFLGLVLPCLALGEPEQATPGGWEDLLARRPEPGSFADLRQWLSGEYEYVRTYRLLDRAYSRLRNGDLDGAVDDFEELQEIHPGHPQLPLYLADLQVRQGDQPRAIEILEEHLSRHPESGYALATLGYLYLDRGPSETASSYLQRALDAYGQRPGATAVRANLAELVYAAGDYPRALDLYHGLRPTLPDDSLLAYRIGLTQRHLGLQAEAGASFRKALEDPDLDDETRLRVSLELAQVLRDGGDPAGAARVVEQLLADGARGDPGLVVLARSQLYVLYLEAGDCTRAVQLYPELKATDLPPRTRAAAGYCEMRLGHPGKAGEIFRRVLADGGLPPADVARVRVELAGLYMEQGDLKRAALTLERMLDAPGAGPLTARRGALQLAEIRVARAQGATARPLLDSLSAAAADEYTALRVYQLYLDLGLSEDARTHLWRLVERGDATPALRSRAEQELAFLLLREGDDAGAAELLQRVAGRSGVGAADRDQAVRALAEVYARTGPAGEALRWAREAWGVNPDPAVGLLLAGLEWRHGDRALAEGLLVAVRQDPTAPGGVRRRAAAELGTVYMEEGRTIEAEEALWAVLDADPQNRYALASLRELAKRRGDGEDYLVFSDQLRRLGLEDMTYGEVAATAAELGEHRRALEMYHELLAGQDDPDVQARILRRMGFSALRLGDRAGAVGYLQRYSEVAPSPDPQALEQLALVHIYDGRCAAALGPLAELERIRQDATDPLRAARCQEQVRDLDAAAAAYSRSLELHYTGNTALALAWVQQRQGRPAAAVTTLDGLAKRSEVEPIDRFEALVSLSILYGEQKEEVLRRDAARRAVAVLPEETNMERALYALVLGGQDDPRLQDYEVQVRELTDAGERQAQALRLSALYETAGVLALAREWAAVAVAAKPTDLARFRRGILLYQAEEFAAARGDFVAALDTHPEAALYLAYVHSELDQGGLAVDVLEAALRRGGNPADLTARMRRQLAHLYLAEGQPKQALKASESAGPEDVDLLQVKARSLLLLGRNEEALEVALRARALSPSRQPQPPMNLLLGDVYRQQERWQDADRQYTLYLQRYPESAEVLYAAAECRRRAGDASGSRELLRRAVAAEPDQPVYLLDYGYALADAEETDQAIGVFDVYLESFPESAEVLEEAGYLNQRQVRNGAAADRFRAAIDQRWIRAPHVEGEEAQRQEQHMDALRRAVWDLEKRFSLAGYLVRSDLGGSGSTEGFRGIIPGQLGVEGGWRPPYIGFRNNRVFELTARLLGSFEEDKWAYDSDSTQLALGAKYKPFSQVNLAISLERLVEIGSSSEDNWLLRGMVSHSWGRQPRFTPGWGHAGSVYGELGRYFQDPKRTAAYFEARDGPLWALSPSWGLIPHVVVDGRWDDGSSPGGTYLEGGVGLELLGGWGETEHRANTWGLSMYARYMAGTFDEAPIGESGKGYRGPAIGIVVRH